MKIYVRYASRLVTVEQLTEAFSPYGKVDSCVVVRNEASGEPIGMAIVEMSDTSAAQATLGQLEHIRVGGTALRLDEQRTGVGRRSGDERRLGTRTDNDRREAARRSALRLQQSGI